MRLLKHTFLFACTLVAVYYSFYYVLFQVQYDGKPWIFEWQNELRTERSAIKKSMDQFDEQKKYDILFLGSSHTYRYYDPELFAAENLNIFLLASSSQTPNLSKAMAKRYSKNSDVFVVEFYPILLPMKGVECFWDWNASLSDYSLLRSAAYETMDLRSLNLLTIKPFIDEYNKTSGDTAYRSKSNNKGYEMTRDSALSITNWTSYDINPAECKKQFASYEELLSMLKDMNKKCVVVFGPIPKELHITNERILNQKMEEICRKFDVHFLNVSRNHSLDSRTQFFDDDHLNQTGVEWFNRLLIAELKKRSLI